MDDLTINDIHSAPDREVAEACKHSTASSGEAPVLRQPQPEKLPEPVPEPTVADIPSHSLGKPTDPWIYRNDDGTVIGAVVRFDPPDGKKKILPLAPVRDSGGEWHWELKAFWSGKKPLYGLDKLAKRPDAPVLIVEGEKTADAAQKLFPEHVVVTWGGTGLAGTADLSPLANRKIVIFPDHDAEGQKAAETIANRLLTEMTVLSVKLVNVPGSLPQKWDLADEIPDGIDVHALVAEAKDVEPPDSVIGDSAISWPDGYEMRRSGLYAVNSKSATKISDPFKPVAQVRDENSNGWGLLLEWKDPDGEPHRQIVSSATIVTDPGKVRAKFADGGLKIIGRGQGREITDALTGVSVTRRARTVKNTGWYGKSFVLPHGTIGDQSDDPVIFNGATTASHFAEAGTFDEWKNGVAARCAGHPIAMMVLCSAFAGPLLEKLGIEAGGFHLFGISSSGKTTLLHVAGSVWGGGTHGFLQTWRATSNSMEGIAAAHNHTLLAIDEIGECDPAHLSEVAYMLTNGQGKGRMHADATPAARQGWRTFVLSTGEVTIAQRIADNRFGAPPRTGQQVRMVDVAADGGTNTGVFAFGDGNEDDKAARAYALAGDLKTASHKNFGHAGPAFVKAMINAERDSVEQAQKRIEDFLAENAPDNAGSQVMRIARRFALVAAAGELAISFGILPWKENDAIVAVTKIFKQWLAARGGAGNREEARVVEAFRDYLQRYGSATFVPVKNNDVLRDSIKDLDGWSREDAFLLTKDTFNKIANGMDRAHAKKVLHQRGFLPRFGCADGGIEYSRSLRLPGLGTRRVFEISKRILEGGDGD